MKPIERKGELVLLPTDDVLVIRNGIAMFQARVHKTNALVPEDALVLMGVAHCFGDDEFRAMMKLVVRDAFEAGDLEDMIEMGAAVSIAEKLRQAYHNDLTDVPLLLDAAEEVDQLEQLVRSFVLETLDYARINNLGDAEQQHNVRRARKLGIKDKLP